MRFDDIVNFYVISARHSPHRKLLCLGYCTSSYV